MTMDWPLTHFNDRKLPQPFMTFETVPVANAAAIAAARSRACASQLGTT